ncbi:polysaccharide deacetylase family protein [Sandaracinobacteroides saxicola]|uniref:Polysaccharide deacetylase n=1 Tax=Sandaracinobacteroides saxicola TaxID=2759707 RepID=A0A7G5IEW1_9SPHN|nr:polysaccharide deacetylase [Sandaracinobacteroides saxicola]QMW21903.1 polysaccharide deacetylase [Sandaracinobacteroides saxicola]
MTLPDSYLDYPRRREGYDHALYPWSNLHSRPYFEWAPGQALAVMPVILAEFFPLTPSDTPFRAPGHMQTAFPDYRHYTARDYGNRVGIWRLLDAFEKRGLKSSVAMNVAIAERYPELLRAVLDGGHDLVAHATDMNGTIDSSLPADTEAALIADTRARWTALGQHPTAWHSIARSQSHRTPDLLMKHGFTTMLDWPNDDLPYRFANGILNIPLNHELSDRQIITVQQQSADSYVQQIQDAWTWLKSEDAPRLLPLSLTPYIIALPYRIGAFEALLDWLQVKNAHISTVGAVSRTATMT